MSFICGVILLLCAGSWLFLRIKCGGRYTALRELPMEGLRLRRLGEPLLLLAERGRIASYLPAVMFRIQRSVQRIYGMRYSAERTLLFMGRCSASAGC